MGLTRASSPEGFSFDPTKRLLLTLLARVRVCDLSPGVVAT